MANLIQKARVVISIPSNGRARLFTADNAYLETPLLQLISADKKELHYRRLDIGDYILVIDFGENSKKINITISQNESMEVAEGIHIKSEIFNFRQKSRRKNGWIRKKYYQYMAHWGWNYTMKRADNLLTVCNYLSEIVTLEIDKPSNVCPTPIDMSECKPTKIQVKHPSACIIQNHQIKPKAEALLGFTEVIRRMPHVTFYVSKGFPRNRGNESYDKIMKHLSRLSNVEFTDITQDNKFNYLSSCDIYILSSGLDCTPASVLEAQLSSKPVLASAVGGVPEMIQNGKTGWTIENDDIDGWVEKIDLLLGDKKLAKKIGKNAREHVLATYELGVISEKLYKIMTAQDTAATSTIETDFVLE